MTKIIEKAYSLLTKPGVKIDHAEALDILGQHGAKVDLTKQMVSISMDLVDRALKSVPKIVDLYDQPGNKAVTLGRGETSFVAGGSAPFILDFETNQPRPVHTMDLIRFLRLSDSLPFLQHTNPSLIPADIPAKIKSAFRCFLSLLNTSKPLCVGMSESGLIRLLMDMRNGTSLFGSFESQMTNVANCQI